ncbi:hypothetical protein [Psychromonas sp. SP041]|uniref:hypothetical protein n=1 Tax=Psychromonas sp. SP041 TaxID=1365007 RepID=UPI00041D4AE8|nr:hypothetical protein [Psychromonas sp. SP041]
MNFIKGMTLILAIVVLSGCVRGLNSIEKKEYAAFERDGVLIEEKNPTTGAVLGILPGFGSFYVGQPSYGLVNLLLWPISILWDPISGYDGAMSINYDVTKYQLYKNKQAEFSVLAEKLATQQINYNQYLAEKISIEQKYNY